MALIHAATAAMVQIGDVVYVSSAPSLAGWSVTVTTKKQTRSVSLTRVQVGEPIDADAFLVVAPREETLALARLYADAMRGHPVLLAPGGVAVVESVDSILRAQSADHSLVAQLPGYLITGQVDADTVAIWAVKQQFPVGALHQGRTQDLVDLYNPWFPTLVPSSLVETTLSNTNNIIHPPTLLLNTARSDNGDAYHFYQDGMSAAVGRLITAVDNERMQVLSHLGYRPQSVEALFHRYYGDTDTQHSPIARLLSNNPALADVWGPATLQHRYVSEDIVCGLAPLEHLAHQLGIATPICTSVISTFSALLATDLRETASQLIADSVLASVQRNRIHVATS